MTLARSSRLSLVFVAAALLALHVASVCPLLALCSAAPAAADEAAPEAACSEHATSRGPSVEAGGPCCPELEGALAGESVSPRASDVQPVATRAALPMPSVGSAAGEPPRSSHPARDRAGGSRLHLLGVLLL